MGATTQLMTFAEFEKLPDEVCRHSELRHGELVFVPPPKHKHKFLEHRLRKLLEALAPGDDVVETEVAFRALTEYEYWTADVAYIPRERWELIAKDGYLIGAPEIVIEVLSPSNTATEM